MLQIFIRNLFIPFNIGGNVFMENEFLHLLLVIAFCIIGVGVILGLCYYANKKSDENPWYMLVPVVIMLGLYLTTRFIH